MKTDTKLFFSIVLLISLVVALIVITLSRNNAVNNLKQEIQNIQQQAQVKIIKGQDGHTPILGLDYTVTNGKNAPVYPAPKDGLTVVGINGLNGDNGLSAYDLAVENGFQGTITEWLNSLKLKGEKGDSAPELDIDCVNGVIVKKYAGDTYGQVTKIKCETIDD